MAQTDVTPDAIITALETMAENVNHLLTFQSLMLADHYLRFFVEEICDLLVAGGAYPPVLRGPMAPVKPTCSNYWKSGL